MTNADWLTEWAKEWEPEDWSDAIIKSLGEKLKSCAAQLRAADALFASTAHCTCEQVQAERQRYESVRGS